MLFVKGYPLVNLWDTLTLNGFDFGSYFASEHFIPVFFITVACGILSGFHSTQITLITRTMKSEREGRLTQLSIASLTLMFRMKCARAPRSSCRVMGRVGMRS